MHFRLTHDTITPDVRRMIAALQNPQPVYEAGGKVLQVEIVKHLKALEARGNANGWPSQHFFSGGPDSVDKRVGLAVSRALATVTIADPRFVHHVQGGKVKPKRNKYLAIPLNAQAASLQGKGTLRESAPWLKFIRRGRTLFLGAQLGDLLKFFFVLKDKATHRPHPRALPDMSVIKPVVRAAVERAVRLLLRAGR